MSAQCKKLTNCRKIIRITLLVYFSSVVVEATQTLGDIAQNISVTSFWPVVRLMIVLGYISGFGFFIAAVFKLKQVKDNPTQIPVSTPFAFLIVGTLLIYLPTFFGYTARTVFGTGVQGDLGKQLRSITKEAEDPSSAVESTGEDDS